MNKTFDLNKINTLADKIEQVLNLPDPLNQEFLEKKWQKNWDRIQKQYEYKDPLEILDIITRRLTPENIDILVDDLYNTFDHVYMQYLSSNLAEETEEVPEFYEYNNDPDHSASSLIHWVKKVSAELIAAYRFGQTKRFQGLLLTDTLIIETLNIEIHKKKQ